MGIPQKFGIPGLRLLLTLKTMGSPLGFDVLWNTGEWVKRGCSLARFLTARG